LRKNEISAELYGFIESSFCVMKELNRHWKKLFLFYPDTALKF